MSKVPDKVPDKVRPTVTSRLGISLPTAIGALLFAGAIAFGSGMVDTQPGKPGNGGNETASSASDKHGGQGSGENGFYKPDRRYHEDTQQPSHSTPDKPKPPKPEPPKPEPPKPEPKPEEQKPQDTKPEKPPTQTTAMSLETAAGPGKVKLFWSKFGGDGFAYYKVVRSTDANVSWPLGSGDTLIAATGDKWATAYKDFPTCGTQFFYRVFAVTNSGNGYQVLAASNVAPGTAQCETPPPPPPPTHPEPTIMGFSATLVDGGVHLDWDTCTGTGFAAYKVVRSQTNPDPNFPLNEGTELATVIGDANTSAFVDLNVTTGQTWFYRVVSVGSDSSGLFTLGYTPVVSVTVP